MIRDIAPVVRKEWLEFLQPEPTRRLRPLRVLGMLVVGGAVVGIQLDPDFGRSYLTVVLVSFLSIMFVTGVIPDAIAGERERHTLETLLATRLPDESIVLGKVLAAVSYGWVMGFAILPPGILVANLVHGVEGEPWLYWDVIGLTFLAMTLSGLLIASVGVLLSLYAPTTRQANQRLGFAMSGFFFMPAIIVTALPPAIRDRGFEILQQLGIGRVVAGVMGLVFVLALAFLAIAVYRFRRARLIL